MHNAWQHTHARLSSILQLLFRSPDLRSLCNWPFQQSGHPAIHRNRTNRSIVRSRIKMPQVELERNNLVGSSVHSEK